MVERCFFSNISQGEERPELDGLIVDQNVPQSKEQPDTENNYSGYNFRWIVIRSKTAVAPRMAPATGEGLNIADNVILGAW